MYLTDSELGASKAIHDIRPLCYEVITGYVASPGLTGHLFIGLSDYFLVMQLKRSSLGAVAGFCPRITHSTGNAAL